jgi:hypothetical protein
MSADSVVLAGVDGVAEAQASGADPIFVWGTGAWSDLLMMLAWLLFVSLELCSSETRGG